MSAEPDTQLLKGTLEICLMALLQEQDNYGYELIRTLEAEGLALDNRRSVYPLLKRLENDGLIESYLQSSTGGPARKYYRIMPEGRKTLQKKALRSFEVYEATRRVITSRVDLDYHDGAGHEGG